MKRLLFSVVAAIGFAMPARAMTNAELYLWAVWQVTPRSTSYYEMSASDAGFYSANQVFLNYGSNWCQNAVYGGSILAANMYPFIAEAKLDPNAETSWLTMTTIDKAFTYLCPEHLPTFYEAIELIESGNLYR